MRQYSQIMLVRFLPPTLPFATAGLWLSFWVIGSTLTVSLAEGLAFRGYLTRKLVSPAFNAHHVKNVSGRQTDVVDCPVGRVWDHRGRSGTTTAPPSR
jgi:hypothetical protein